ncbi:MAG: ABC transporter substrate-binding protein [Calditrichaeota bacterium]|nr:ABC transporter substrate-binding protein [Calditrichota bacterium]
MKKLEFQVAVFQIIEIEPVADLRKGFSETLMASDLGKAGKIKILPYKDAQNDVTLTNQIADQIVSDKPDLIYVLGTPVAQAIAERTKTIPIVQGGVTDPVAAKLAASWDGSGRNYAASTDLPPVQAIFEIASKALPNAKRIGVVFGSGESNSQAVMARVRIVAKNLGMELVERTVTNTSEVSSATVALVGNVDAIFVPTDNTVHQALPSLLQVAKDNKLPVFDCTRSSVEAGALFALGGSYEEMGRTAGKIASEILSGTNPGTIPIAFVQDPELYWNEGVAEELGVSPVGDVKSSIDVWIRNGQQVSAP